MTAVYLYGLVRRPDLAAALDELPVQGLLGPVQAVRIGPYSLAFGASDGQPAPHRRRFLKGHARVLEDLLPFGPLLPFRYGHAASDPTQIARLVQREDAEISALFAKIDGHVEIGVRVDFDREDAFAATLAGNSELGRMRDELIRRGGGERMAQINLGQRVAEALDARRTMAQRLLLKTLKPLIRDHVLKSPEDDVQVLRAAFLVASARVDAFTETLETAATNCGFAPRPPRIRVVYPTPPFNFVSLSLGNAEAVDAVA